MTEKCFGCGNTNEKEIEYRRVLLDDGWKEVEKYVWVCKDVHDCGMRMFGGKN